MIDGLSLETTMAEQRFLESELGVRWQQVDRQELTHALRSGPPRMLIVSDPNLYAESLADAPAGSAIVIQISDEAYSPERRAMLDIPAVRTIFRQYAPQPTSRAQIARAIIGFAKDSRNCDVPARSALPLYRSGSSVRARMNTWPRVGYHCLPLGYTNAFSAAWDPTTASNADRAISIVFRGNRGLAPRIVGTAAARQMNDSLVTFVEDHAWSGAGDQGSMYVQELTNARFALVPPGFVNAETFRYYEALRSGALPVEINVALTHQGALPFRTDSTIRADSWQRALAIATAIPETERRSRVAAAQATMDRAFTQARDQLSRSMEG